jgi:ribose-phosphate pyrophosphokinase
MNGVFMEKIIIVGPSSQLLAMRTAKEMKIKAIETEYKRFPDGENYLRINVKSDDDLKGKEIIIIQTTGANTAGDQNQRIMELIMMISASKKAGAGKIRVVVPYFAYSRQDKVFRPGESLMAQNICRMIELAGADELFSIDMHAPEVFSVLKIPTHNLDPMKLLAEYIKTLDVKNPIIVSPDKGATERSRAFANYFGKDVPVEQFSKERDVVTGQIKMTGELKVTGKDVIIADDIIATGGTMASAIEISKKSGARKVIAVGTHALLIVNAVHTILSAGCDVIVGTDTLDTPVSMVSMAKLLADNLK